MGTMCFCRVYTCNRSKKSKGLLRTKRVTIPGKKSYWAQLERSSMYMSVENKQGPDFDPNYSAESASWLKNSFRTKMRRFFKSNENCRYECFYLSSNLLPRCCIILSKLHVVCNKCIFHRLEQGWCFWPSSIIFFEQRDSWENLQSASIHWQCWKPNQCCETWMSEWFWAVQMGLNSMPNYLFFLLWYLPKLIDPQMALKEVELSRAHSPPSTDSTYFWQRN